MIDIGDKKVYVILKNGFAKKYLDREIYVRDKFSYMPIPKRQSIGRNDLWYCEEHVSGLSPDRIGGKKGRNVLWKAVQHIHKMLNSTKKNVPLSKYVIASSFSPIV